jgi:Protein of unknown function (DUF1566)
MEAEMNRAGRFAVGITTLLLGAVEVAAQTPAPGPYFPPPSWDLTLPCPSAANCSRFVLLTNITDAFMDLETGLVWYRFVPGFTFANWANAQAKCTALAASNRMGWRLPTIAELTSLLDSSVPPGSKRLPAGAPFGFIDVEANYWSSTVDPTDSNNAYTVVLPAGSVAARPKTESLGDAEFCVRGGIGVGR